MGNKTFYCYLFIEFDGSLNSQWRKILKVMTEKKSIGTTGCSAFYKSQLLLYVKLWIISICCSDRPVISTNTDRTAISIALLLVLLLVLWLMFASGSNFVRFKRSRPSCL